MSLARVISIVLGMALAAAVALFFGRRMQAGASATYGAYLRELLAKFAPMQQPGELAPVWACVGNETAGAIGVTDRRVVLAVVNGFELIERSDLRSVQSIAKDFGGARTLPGYEITLERSDGRRYVLPVVERAEYLPPEHDVAAVLARLGPT